MTGYSFADLLMKNMETPMVEVLGDLGLEIDTKSNEHKHYRLKAPGYMDLIVEIWKEGNDTMMSVCHYYEQNGDLMKDPEIMYKLIEYENDDKNLVWEDAQWIQQDPVGVFRQVYVKKDGKTFVNRKPKEELRDFSKMWANNIKNQGFRLEQGND